MNDHQHAVHETRERARKRQAAKPSKVKPGRVQRLRDRVKRLEDRLAKLRGRITVNEERLTKAKGKLEAAVSGAAATSKGQKKANASKTPPKRAASA